jgi:hypothetical protein
MVAIVNGPSRFLSHEPLVEWHWQRIDFFVQPDAGKCMEQIVTCPNLVERTMRHASREPPGRTEKQSKAGAVRVQAIALISWTPGLGDPTAYGKLRGVGWATGLLLLVDV